MGEEAQQEIQVASDLIRALAAGRGPKPLEQPSGWLAKVWTLLPEFVEYDSRPGRAGAAASSAADAGEMCKGVAALRKRWEIVEQKEAAEIKDLDLFSMWAPWLPDDLQKAVDAKRKAVMTRVKAAVGSAAKARPEKPAKKSSSAEADAQAAVFAILRRKS